MVGKSDINFPKMAIVDQMGNGPSVNEDTSQFTSIPNVNPSRVSHISNFDRKPATVKSTLRSSAQRKGGIGYYDHN